MRRPTGSLAAAALLALACGRAGGERPARDAPVAVAAETRSDGRGPGAAGERGTARRGDRHARARAAARHARPVKRVEGTLAAASARRVVIQPAGQPTVALRLSPGTAVILDGRRVPGAALREGDEVRASYRDGPDGAPTAVSIEARAERAAPAAPPPPSPHAERHARPEEP